MEQESYNLLHCCVSQKKYIKKAKEVIAKKMTMYYNKAKFCDWKEKDHEDYLYGRL